MNNWALQVALPYESEGEIVRSDHSNGTFCQYFHKMIFCFLAFYKMKLENFAEIFT